MVAEKATPRTILFKPYCPGFVNDGEPLEGPMEVTSLEQLLQVPQVRRFLDSGAELSLSPHGDLDTLLMGTMPDGQFLVIGYLPANVQLELPTFGGTPTSKVAKSINVNRVMTKSHNLKVVVAEIYPHIYLGNIEAAECRGIIRDFEIEACFNVSTTAYISPPEVPCFAVPLRDNAHNLPTTLLAASLLIDEMRSRYQRFLLHCHHGGSRSVGVLMLWLVRSGFMKTLKDAREHVQQCYPLELSSRQPRPGIMLRLEQALKL